jgi:hypothetical protein
MRKLSLEVAEEIARSILDEHKVKDQHLLSYLTQIISIRGSAPKIRIYWDAKLERLALEVVE